ncbi:MAG: SRPBCC domain-containing protein, partial [Pseudomonadota bacterium]
MAKSSFVYVTYIRTTPEKLWRALTQPEFTRQYWVGTIQESEWKKGASWKMIAP